MHDPAPMISIVTATHNSTGEIETLLESLRTQDSRNFEWVVQDGASSDGTVALIEKAGLPVRVDVLSSPDTGIYQAFNRAVSRARGKYLLFLGADDSLAAPTVISQLVSLIEGGGEPDLLLGSVRMGNRRTFHSSLGPRVLLINTVHHQGALYRRALFTQFRYDEKEPVVADYELNVKLYLARVRVVRTDVLVASCGDEGVSQTTGERALYRTMHVLRRRHVNPAISFACYIAGMTNVLRRKLQAGRSRGR